MSSLLLESSMMEAALAGEGGLQAEVTELDIFERRQFVERRQNLGSAAICFSDEDNRFGLPDRRQEVDFAENPVTFPGMPPIVW